MSEVLAGIFSIAFFAQVVRIAVPYALASLGGAITERAGVIDLALEAKLLFGAFAAAALAHATGSALVGILGGIGAGMIVAAIQIGCALGFGADQVIVGVALNVLALGGTRLLLQLLYHESANSPLCPGFGSSVLGNPLVWFAALAAIVVPVALRRTRWGLRLRAAGDRPDALVAVGLRPDRARLAAALVGGALAGAGGAQLSLAVNGFSADMSSGRGYMALAMVILSGWRPGLAALACIGVAFAEALTILLQILHIPLFGVEWLDHAVLELAPLLPYVLTLLVLVIAGTKHRPPPEGLGKQ